MKRSLVVTVLLVINGAALAGCASRGAPSGAAPSGGPAVSPSVASPSVAGPSTANPSTTRESPMPSLPPLTSKYPSTPASGEITVTGTVEAGVERGCVMLRAGGAVYQLVGKDPAIVMGARVTVRGRPDPGLITTCQQGTPLHVLEVKTTN
jgi:hypothetical protein